MDLVISSQETMRYVTAFNKVRNMQIGMLTDLEPSTWSSPAALFAVSPSTALPATTGSSPSSPTSRFSPLAPTTSGSPPPGTATTSGSSPPVITTARFPPSLPTTGSAPAAPALLPLHHVTCVSADADFPENARVTVFKVKVEQEFIVQSRLGSRSPS